MSVSGANLIASMEESIKLDESWECLIPFKTKHFLKQIDEGGCSYLVPNFSRDSAVEVNIMDCFKEKNKLVLDSFRLVTLKYPKNALLELEFDGEVSLQEMIHTIKTKAKLHGTSLVSQLSRPR